MPGIAPALAERSQLRFDSLPPLALYVHLPWCVRKCPYCDFNSYEAKGSLPENEYVTALLRDFESERSLLQGREIHSIFIGGGTPSLFSGAAVSRLLSGIRGLAPVARDAEVTLEANPGAIEVGRFAEFRLAGITRLSIGIQSFRDEQLRSLGRVHSADEAKRAVDAARMAGFDNFNLDLMYGLPADTVEGAIADLQRAVALQPAHVSWYQLTLEPNTAFARRPPRLPNDERVSEIEACGRELLGAAGYQRYEISAYALPGRQCEHNNNYWRFGDYLGIGAGAHGKVTRIDSQTIERRAKTRNPRTYAQGAGSPNACSIERIESARQTALEFLINALRLVDGVSERCFVERAGQPVSVLADSRDKARALGWLDTEHGMLRATPRGLQLLNPLLELFV